MPAGLDELLDAELGRGMAAFEPAEAPSLEAPDLVAPGLSGMRRRENITELAELLSGTSDKKSKAYRTARRNVERWSPSERMRARGAHVRQPNVVSKERLGVARKQQNEYLRRLRLRGGEMRVLIVISSDRPRWKPPHDWIHIRQAPMRRTLRLWAEGDHETAAAVLFGEFMDQYSVANPEDWERLSEVEEMRLETVPE